MLYLIPNLLDENSDHRLHLPNQVGLVIQNLDGFIVESEKIGRKFLQRFIKKIQDVPIKVLNEHSSPNDIDHLAAPMQKGERWGLLSDAGLAAIADPGASLIRRLHGLKIPVKTFPGPSSIVYALQMSGIYAQTFTFHGYLPRKPDAIKNFFKYLKKNHTHICIEAPYRTDKLIHTLIDYLPPEASLSVASNLTLPTEQIIMQKVAKWKKNSLVFGKIPAVFVFRIDHSK